MKKKLILAIINIIILIIAVYAIFNKKGDIYSVNIISKESKIYSKNDIDNAIDETLNYFKENFEGCSLLELEYIGDEENNGYTDWARRNNKEQVIVFVSSFNVDSSGGEHGALNPNSKYEGWKWILVKNENEYWKCVDCGQG